MPDVVRGQTFNWVVLDDSRRIPVFHDAAGAVVEPMVRYALAVSRSKARASAQAYATALADVAHHLGAYQSFLDLQRQLWTHATDKQLEEFREAMLSRVVAKVTCRSERSARRTVNRYVRSVYSFLLWAQEEAGLVHGLLGWPEAPVATLLVRRRAEPEESYPAGGLYPACFTKCGEGSRHRFQYVATPIDIDRLLELFFDTQGLEAAERNALILALADQVGWRQGSVVSLQTDQFGADTTAHARAHGFAWITPPVQKLGYDNAFEVPRVLVDRVAAYINGPRADLLAALRVTEAQAARRVFLNVKNGDPLSPHAVSQIFSRAFKKIGAPRGSGAHSLRRKFADDRIDLEMAVRKRENRTTDPVNVGVVLQRALGQSSIRSQEAYARAITRGTWSTLERRQQARIQELENRNAALEAQLARGPDSADA